GPGEIGWHYVKLALLIGAVGVALGWAFGTWGARGMAAIYQIYFDFPFLLFVQQLQVYALAAFAGLATTVAGAALAVRRVLALAPAVAMSPPAPTHFRRGLLDRVLALMGLRQTVLMVVRNLVRWPVRAGMTTLGLAASCAVMVASLFMFDAIDEVLETAFFQANRQDATLTLSMPRPLIAEEEVARLPGVMVAEGVLSVPARVRAGQHSRLVAVEGPRAGADLSRVLDADSDQVLLPGQGLVLSRRLAGILGVAEGDAVTLEILTGTRAVHEVPVTGLITQYFGMGAFMDFEALNALLGQAPQVSAVHVRLDAAQLDALYDEVKRLPGLAEVTLWTQVRQSFDDTLAESAGVSIVIATILAALIVVGVAYNAARIQLSERARELAGLRILGFTRGEVSVVLMAELALLTALAIPLGFAMGAGVAHWLAASMSTDLYSFPVVIGRGTLIQSGLTVAAAAAASALVVRRRIDRFDLVAVMKTRE
ncbi:MAG: ABC transporter permease, partial [Rhodobacteraceae bacterium]|nr:ABC transporter permease [Paracoccaceae bacterium]